MTGSVTERLDMLVGDSLAHQTALIALAKNLSEEERAAAIAQCREIIDALVAHPETNARGQTAFQQAETILALIFGQNAP